MSRRDSDRNLLFGILALQMDFVTREGLIAAMNAWVLEKHRPLGEVLVDRGALDPKARDLLDPMVDLHVARHGGDPLASLAALSSAGEVASDLRHRVVDLDVHASLAAVAPDRADDPYATSSKVPPPPLPGPARFRKLREHAAGNLGVVYVARDQELNREVALKEIKERNADHDHHQAKFLLEAEVTGGLEHPGIVPVYGLGHHEDGRPYYAMRFIRGRSLLDAIRQFHADESLKSDPGRRTLALQKLLRRFTDVCNAVAYAHSRGVLHRDLKPANVMVGKYGETLVVDWGLAKALGRSGDPEGMAHDPDDPLPETSLQPSTVDRLDATQAGSVVGTPAYMSPEQAAGRLDLLGPASDVYGLGATLYHLLVGRPPVESGNLGELLSKIQAGEIPRPRALNPWLDPALEAVCLKAMSLKPEDRYTTPRALAEDLDRWIAGEPVAAYPEPWSRRARRWARKHRTGLATAASAATVAALLLGAVTWLQIAQRRKVDASALALQSQAEAFAIEARATGDLDLWEKAIAEAVRAGDRLESGGSPALRRDVDVRLETLRAEEARRRAALETEERDRRMVAALEEARLQASSPAEDGGYDTRGKLEGYLAAFRGYGIDVATLPVEDAATQIRFSHVTDDLIAALDDWVRDREINVPPSRLEAIARAADADQGRAAIREAVARGDGVALRRLCEGEKARLRLGPGVRYAFNALIRLDPEANFTLLEAIRREHPSDFWLNHDLGSAYLNAKPPRDQDAVRCLSIAVALRPNSPGVHNNLGLALKFRGEDQAIAEYREAIRLKPDYVQAHTNLGSALADQGETDQAIAEHREAIRLKPDIALIHSNLGVALFGQGKTDQAIAEYREAIRLKPEDAVAHYNLGVALFGQGKTDQAIAEHREAIRLKPDFAVAHHNLGIILNGQGETDQAIVEYGKAIRHKPDLARAHYDLGVALFGQGETEQAIAAYREAIRLKPDYALAYVNLGDALKAQGKLDEAVVASREAIRLKPDYVNAHVSLGFALGAQGKLDEAIAAYREAIRLKPDYALAFYDLGLALEGQEKLDEAIAAYREAIRLKPDYAEVHNDLGLALDDQGKLDEAIAAYREAIRLKPDYALAFYDLGLALEGQGKLDEAIATYREAIRLKPDYAEVHNDLGLALKARGKTDEAVAAYREAIRLRPDDARAHFELGGALRARGETDEAIAAYREAIRLRSHYSLAHHDLGLALKARGKTDEAIAAYREAIRLKPNYAQAYYNLGNALRAQGQVDPAIAAYREAIRLKPDDARAYLTLGRVLSHQGQLGEALSLLERGHELGSRQPNWNQPSDEWVREARRDVELEPKVLAIGRGEATPRDADERMALAGVCYKTGRHAMAARFADEAFAEKPELAEGLEKGSRYNAACSAALAGSGQGKDDPAPDEMTRVRLREKALAWLRADLALRTKQLESGGEPARQTILMQLAFWKNDRDLAEIRDEAALSKWPEGEREAFRSFWADVEAIRKKAEGGEGR